MQLRLDLEATNARLCMSREVQTCAISYRWPAAIADEFPFTCDLKSGPRHPFSNLILG